MPLAYVPQETLYAPAEDGTTWLQKYDGGELEAFSHPYEYLLFLGRDSSGDLIPVQELRNVYGVPRKDVYPPEGSTPDESSDGGGPADEGGPGGDSPKQGQ